MITVKNLGKKYRIGQQGLFHGKTFRETLSGLFSKEKKAQDFWALKDLCLDISHGERVGIIGRNGAGKSTFLKILSRITHPTTGMVRIKGRVSSLLEVGTGFHPELTGRENIFLNGSILGMTRNDIKKKLDEIVAFSEIEKFLDTPAKRYSSGMYVRLAFAVAAHLEPEILIVDEVLAVGDAGFQKKCLGKMKDIGSEGRTVILVSHSIPAIENLCSRVMILDNGQKVMDGRPDKMILNYLNLVGGQEQQVSLSERKDRNGSGEIRIISFVVLDSLNKPTDMLMTGKDYVFRFGYKARIMKFRRLDFSFTVRDARGQVLFRNSMDESGVVLPDRLETEGFFDCRMPRLCLTGGRYVFDFRLVVNGIESDQIIGSMPGSFDVIDGDYFGTSKISNFAPMVVDHKWEIS